MVVLPAASRQGIVSSITRAHGDVDRRHHRDREQDGTRHIPLRAPHFAGDVADLVVAPEAVHGDHRGGSERRPEPRLEALRRGEGGKGPDGGAAPQRSPSRWWRARAPASPSRGVPRIRCSGRGGRAPVRTPRRRRGGGEGRSGPGGRSPGSRRSPPPRRRARAAPPAGCGTGTGRPSSGRDRRGETPRGGRGTALRCRGAPPRAAHRTSPSASESSAPRSQAQMMCGPPIAATISGIVRKGPIPTIPMMFVADGPRRGPSAAPSVRPFRPVSSRIASHDFLPRPPAAVEYRLRPPRDPARRPFLPPDKETPACPFRIATLAPDFTAPHHAGNHPLPRLDRRRLAILFSHPKDFTPVCTTELGYMAGLRPEFEKRNCKIIGLSVDPVEDHERWKSDIEETQGHAVEYPLIGDDDPRGGEALRHDPSERPRRKAHRAGQHDGPLGVRPTSGSS